MNINQFTHFQSIFCRKDLCNMKFSFVVLLIILPFLFTQREQFLQYSHYIRNKPELDSPLVTQAADFFRVRLFR